MKLRLRDRQSTADLAGEVIRNFLVTGYGFDVPGLRIGPELVLFPLTLQKTAMAS